MGGAGCNFRGMTKMGKKGFGQKWFLKGDGQQQYPRFRGAI
jgi:hypothetical protein